jgi:hypothetical protein
MSMSEKITMGFCKYLIVNAFIDSLFPSLPVVDEGSKEAGAVVSSAPPVLPKVAFVAVAGSR